jgi:hypothetical protein
VRAGLEFFVAEEGAFRCRLREYPLQQSVRLDTRGGRRPRPRGARLGALLQVLIAREPSQEMPIIRTWWPRAFAVPPQYKSPGAPTRATFSWCGRLRRSSCRRSAADVFYWRADYFDAGGVSARDVRRLRHNKAPSTIRPSMARTVPEHSA